MLTNSAKYNLNQIQLACIYPKIVSKKSFNCKVTKMNIIYIFFLKKT